MSTPTLSFHPFVRSAPSFRPDLHTARAVAHSGGQGWPVFGPPRQRRAASLTVASTAARLVASGCLAGTHQTWRKKRAHVQLKKLAHAHQLHAPFTPVAAYPVLRSPARHLLPAQVFPALFPQCSLPWLLTTAAWGGLTPTPESRCRWAYHHLSVSYHVILGHHSFPLMFLQHTVEQDRAPAVLSHHPKLARQAADRSPRRRKIDRRDNDQDRTEGRLRARHAHLPKGHQ